MWATPSPRATSTSTSCGPIDLSRFGDCIIDGGFGPRNDELRRRFCVCFSFAETNARASGPRLIISTLAPPVRVATEPRRRPGRELPLVEPRRRLDTRRMPLRGDSPRKLPLPRCRCIELPLGLRPAAATLEPSKLLTPPISRRRSLACGDSEVYSDSDSTLSSSLCRSGVSPGST